jgi:biotin carboxyl carrier protein
VAAVLCSVGDVVSRGQTLVVIEAMKTELRINAPVEGRVVRIDVAPGDQVEEGAGLVQLAASSEAATGAVRE